MGSICFLRSFGSVFEMDSICFLPSLGGILWVSKSLGVYIGWGYKLAWGMATLESRLYEFYVVSGDGFGPMKGFSHSLERVSGSYNC